MLEESRVAGGETRGGTVVIVHATERVRPECLTRTLARHDGAVPRRRPHLKLRRARGEEVGRAPNDGAHAITLVRGHRHGDVEAVDEADAV